MEGYFLSILLLTNTLTIDIKRVDENLRDVTGPFPTERACEIYFHGSFTKSEISGHVGEVKFSEVRNMMFADFEIVKGTDAGDKVLAIGKCQEIRTP